MPVTRMNIMEENAPAASVEMTSNCLRLPVISANAPTMGASRAATKSARDTLNAKILEAVSRASASAAGSLAAAPAAMNEGAAMAIKYGGKKVAAVTVI